ncbi:MAG: CHAT domain-containing protein [Thermoanaerobaculia bacterium]
MTNSRTIVFSCCLAAVVVHAPSPPAARDAAAAGAGIVVERVETGGAAALAGIRRGDILMSWQRPAVLATPSNASGGELGSPFDLSRVEIEQGPRGIVLLAGLREGRSMRFEMLPRAWGLKTRPRLPDPPLAAYVQGEREIREGRVPQGIAVWRRAAERLPNVRPADGAWWESRIAEVFFRAGNPRNAGDAWEAAIRKAPNGDWWTRASLRASYADALLRIGLPARAEAQYREGLDVAAAAAPEGLVVAFLIERLGEVEESVENLTQARDLYARALAIRQRLAPDSVAVAASLNALGRVAAERELAEELCIRSLTLWESLAPDSLEAARALNDLGALYFQRGDVLAAQRLHERALAICRRNEPEGLDFATSLYRLGNVAWRRGDLASAEDLHRRALAIRRNLAPGSAAVESSLNSLGNVAGTRKDLASAERFHREALVMGEKRAPETVDAMIHNLGEDARLLGNYAAAEVLFRRALGMYDRLPPGSARDAAVANTLISLAAVARDRGDLAEAERLARRALAIRESHEPESLHLAEDREVLADILRASGRNAEARQAYDQILRVASRTVPGSELEARALHSLGVLDRREGRADPAAEMFGRAVDALDSQKGRIGGPMEAREVFSAVYADYYRDLIEALVDRRRQTEAFAVLERSHARLLLTMIAERDLSLPSGLPPGLEETRDREDAEYDQTLRELRDLDSKQHKRRQELLERRAALRDRRAETLEKIKKASPQWASLRYPQPLSLEGTRSALDPGTLLLAYSVGKERSFLFAVEPAGAKGAGLTVYALPANDRSLREAVAAQRNLLGFRAPAGAEAARQLSARSRELYEKLLQPADSLIAGYERLLILPDGPLHTLPWAALALGAAKERPRFLVEWKPIHTAISATVYAERRKSRPQRPRETAVTVVAFGDPKYPKLPEKRVAARLDGAAAETWIDMSEDVILEGDASSRPSARSGLRFEPLPETRREVREIAALFAPKSAAYLGLEATEERAKAIGKDVPLIHYACHAVVNERFPLDSALAFTIPVKPREGQDNGLLQAWEIFEKVRIDADLVTLSACESGLGREMGGEGLIGLTRAFQYAGARSVLASLWKVEDKSTAELMKRFYGYVKAGRPKDEALRLAQIDLIRSADFSQPRDWAAFQLNGDWK